MEGGISYTQMIGVEDLAEFELECDDYLNIDRNTNQFSRNNTSMNTSMPKITTNSQFETNISLPDINKKKR